MRQCAAALPCVAVAVVALGESHVLLRGRGNCVVAAPLSDAGSGAAPEQALPLPGGLNVHGLADLGAGLVVALTGPRATVVQVGLGPGGAPTLQVLASLGPFAATAMDATLASPRLGESAIAETDAAADPAVATVAAVVAVAVADNSVHCFGIAAAGPPQLLSVTRGQTRCLLYGMRLLRRGPGDVAVASLTIFHNILLWTALSSGLDSETARPEMVLRGHEGSVFRAAWIPHGPGGEELLATVSDDRSLRVWSLSGPRAGEQRAAGWAHNARVWDVAALSHPELGTVIATAGEEGVLRVWRLTGSGDALKLAPAATLAGHTPRNIWRVVIWPGSAPGAPWVVSAGNDGSVKFWPLPYVLAAVPDDRVSPMEKELLLPRDAVRFAPAPPRRVRQRTADAAPAVEAAAVAEPSPGEVLRDYLVDIAVNPVPLGEAGEVTGVLVTHGGALCAFALGAGQLAAPRWLWVFQLGGSPVAQMSVNWSLGLAVLALQSNELVLVRITGPSCVRIASWRAAKFRAINAWVLAELASGEALVATADSETVTRLWLAGAGGGARLLQTCRRLPRFDPACCTLLRWPPHPVHGISALGLQSLHAEGAVFVLASRGGAIATYPVASPDSAFAVPAEAELPSATGPEATPALQALGSCHGNEQIARVEASGHTLRSLGHDGFLREHRAAADAATPVFRCTASISAGACSFLRVAEQTRGGLFVAGFHGSDLICLDAERGAMHLRVRGGSWRRPHATAIVGSLDPAGAVPRVVHVQAHTAGSAPSDAVAPLGLLWVDSRDCAAGLAPGDARLWRVGRSGTGRVVHDAAFLGPDPATGRWLGVATSEDLSLRLFAVDAAAGTLELSSPFGLHVAGSRRVLVSAGAGAGAPALVVGLGAKLEVKLFRTDPGLALEPSRADQLSPLVELRNSVFLAPHATVDHRILSADAAALSPLQHLCVAGDSDGVCRLMLVDAETGDLQVLGELVADGKPVLAVALVWAQSHLLLLTATTAGRVVIWDVTGVAATRQFHAAGVQRLLAYEPHLMGVNALAARHDPAERTLWVASVGDDQSLAVAAVRFAPAAAGAAASPAAVAGFACEAVRGACACALQGVAWLGERTVLTVGSDRRVARWALSPAALLEVGPAAVAEEGAVPVVLDPGSAAAPCRSRVAAAAAAGEALRLEQVLVSAVGDIQGLAVAQQAGAPPVALVFGEGCEAITL